MSDEKAIYWLSQVGGWFGFVLLILFQSLLEGSVEVGIVKVLILNFIIGIGLSHTMRYFIVHYGLLEMKVLAVLARIIPLSIAFSVLASFIYASFSDLFFTDVEPILVAPYLIILQLVFPFSIIFLFWNILYFASIYLKNYEREEVKNLRLTASITEVELSNLRTQLNPHFMFNALNSIRTLVDENPAQAKKSITQMSSILRNSMMAGKKRFVPLSEELKVVEDYLDLEKIRFEERLGFRISVPEDLMRIPVPPLLLQTLAENAVKHGISNLPDGGVISLSAMRTEDGHLEIHVTNSGRYDPFEKRRQDSHGIGLTNSRRRLKILYGDKATIGIANEPQGVVCTVRIPIENTKNQVDENLID